MIAPLTVAETVSLPSRGAWIEITGKINGLLINAVAPLAGSVD